MSQFPGMQGPTAPSSSQSARMQPSSFQRLLGIKGEQLRPDVQDQLAPIHTARYTKTEQETFFRNTFVRDARSQSQTFNAQGLLNIFIPAHEEIGKILFNIEKLKVLAPEINQAAMIRVSSIMAPNDLQDGVFKFSLANLPQLDEDVRERICKYITDYFDEVIGLGQKAEKWVKDCLYGVGNTPLFLFPTTHFQAFRKDGFLNPSGDGNIQVSTEGLKELRAERDRYYRRDQYQRIHDHRIFTGNKSGLESIGTRLERKEQKNSLYDKVYSDMRAIDDTFFSFDSEGLPQNIVIAMEKIRVTLTKELEEGDGIRLSENPEIVKFAGEYRKRSMQTIERTVESTFDTPMYYQTERAVSLQKYDENTEDEIGHPYFIVLPPESVIPIIVPGDPKNHLGYFLLVDEFGHPLEAKDLDTAGCGAPSVAAAYNAMFRGSCADAKPGLDRYSKAMANSVFDHLLDQYIKAKLQDIGLENVDVMKANGIAAVMFYRLLEHKKTSIVFIPKSLLTYLAFDYRPNGTGRSLLEDIQFILSLRATFMVASVMAMANDAINHHTLGVTFDEKTVNPEQIIENIGNQYVDKKRMRLSIDPTDISRNIARNAVTIIPKNLPGVGGFDIENNVSPGQSIKPDNELMDHFNNLLVTALGVPYAALNQLSDTEYSRSIVTTNLFFSKQIRRDQKTLCEHINHFVRMYIRYSKPLKLGILEILANKGRIASSPNDKLTPVKLKDTGSHITNKNDGNNETEQHAKMLGMIIDHITATLPTPNLAPDKAQYEELKTFIQTVQEFSNLIFPPELIPQEDAQATLGLNIAKSNWVRDQCVDLYDRLGSSNTLTFPSIDDLGLQQINWAENIQAYKNFGKFMQDTMSKLSSAEAGMDMGMGMGDPMMGGDASGMDDGSAGDDPFAIDDTSTSNNTTTEPKPEQEQPSQDESKTPQEEKDFLSQM